LKIRALDQGKNQQISRSNISWSEIPRFYILKIINFRDLKNDYYLTGHLILCSLMSGLLYPIVAHWVWDKKVSN
jgi:hypothetical protein